MAQHLTTTKQASLALAAEPTKWIAPTLLSLLDDDGWHPDDCKADLARMGVALATVRDIAETAIAPVEPKWLADRLKAVWQSTTPTSSMTADVWLRETGRLTKHLPADIAHYAIDKAVSGSSRGFTPSAGAILDYAKPLIEQRLRVKARIDRMMDVRPEPWRYKPPSVPEDELCTPEEAAEIRRQYGIPDPEQETQRKGLDASQLRVPTPEELAALAAEMNGGGA